ncbi:MAG: biotin transporter BioY [Firmicutes bacterium]|nr:biotin transporter BioY [Bacillota bacterium]
MMVIALFIALLTALGYVNIPLPFSPVPLTGQTFGVMLAGMLLGSRLGFITLLVFDLTGLVFPVFAGAAGGIGKLLGPTGGYILSWPLAAAVIGLLVEREQHPDWIRFFLANILGGVLIVYSLGVLQLSLVTGMGLIPAFISGALPFIPGDLIKCAVAAAVGLRLRQAYPAITTLASQSQTRN